MRWHPTHWIPDTALLSHSVCGVYAIEGRYIDGAFAWRARVIDTDVLIASSHDRGYVEGVVERHAQSAVEEAS